MIDLIALLIIFVLAAGLLGVGLFLVLAGLYKMGDDLLVGIAFMVLGLFCIFLTIELHTYMGATMWV